MSFYGCHFSFDGISCEEYGLMLYEFGQSNTENVTLTPDADIIEDRISRRFTPLHYGVVYNKPLEFNMTFGADINAIDNNTWLDRWDLETIAVWLTGHQTYKWLEVTQPDMETFRYKCFITNLKHVDIGKVPWGFTCTVLCDSPFAYTYPETFTYTLNGNNEDITLYNKSSYRGYYKPKIEIFPGNLRTFSICNCTDNDYTTMFTGLPRAINSITIDNENEIITCNDNLNPYPYFNFNFFRLVRGNNLLRISGDGTLKITCEFPISVGG